MNLIVWFIGSNGTGKTTQMRMLIDSLKDNDGITNYEPGKHCFIDYGSLSVVGKLGSNQCSGLDTVFPDIKLEGVIRSLKMVKTRLVILESIMATFNWYNEINTNILNGNDRTKLLVFHLDLTMFENFQRIQQRRAKKKSIEDWWNVPLEDTVYKSVGGKNNNFRNLASKIRNSGIEVVTLKAMANPKQIHDQVLKRIVKFL